MFLFFLQKRGKDTLEEVEGLDLDHDTPKGEKQRQTEAKRNLLGYKLLQSIFKSKSIHFFLLFSLLY